MNYWLVKTEPGTFSWSDFVKAGKTVWDGVRNFQARNHLKAMKKGDTVLVYHSGDDKAVIGLAYVCKEAYPEPKAPDWVAVDLQIGDALKKPVTLAEVKAHKELAEMVLVRASRLSVQPVKAVEFDLIMRMSKK
jgi:predicted RNA-binding protein with PUA-like domain